MQQALSPRERAIQKEADFMARAYEQKRGAVCACGHRRDDHSMDNLWVHEPCDKCECRDFTRA